MHVGRTSGLGRALEVWAGGLAGGLPHLGLHLISGPNLVFSHRLADAVRSTGAGRAGAGRRQERRPGRGPCRARGAERAALKQ
jgi:hypothetical protein